MESHKKSETNKSMSASERVIADLREAVVSIHFSETLRPKKVSIDRELILERAKAVRKHLSDDSLSTETPARP